MQLFFNLAVLNLCNSSIMCPENWERCEYITEEETKAWCIFPETISMPLHHIGWSQKIAKSINFLVN